MNIEDLDKDLFNKLCESKIGVVTHQYKDNVELQSLFALVSPTAKNTCEWNDRYFFYDPKCDTWFGFGSNTFFTYIPLHMFYSKNKHLKKSL